MKIYIPIVAGILLASACTYDQAQVTDINKSEQTNASPRNTSIDAATLIRPGSGIGEVTLGANAERLYEKMGKPDVADAAMGKSIDTWYDDHDVKSYSLSVYTVRDLGKDNPPAIIQQIRITAPQYRTDDRVGVGTSLSELQDRYKLEAGAGYHSEQKPVRVYTDTTGIAFEINEEDECIGVLVYPKGTLQAESYLKFIQ